MKNQKKQTQDMIILNLYIKRIITQILKLLVKEEEQDEG